ncbi:MAG: hypothetical protein ONB44_10785 [candidate division KSB1 bacterium]|nr:hypothetical protein [candidate division KSB1 bacterium]MDZ7302609.1 hypothetical protein [candidate division KSB1 bacterium]MDZ7311551.1 hypothetical protein [candidate division KSB1 bacterium]
MNERLKADEEKFIHELLAWDAQRRPMEWILGNVALFLGGVMILVIGIFTIRHLTDRLILLITVPGFISGILFVGLYIFISNRIKERRRMASILKKLGAS